MTRQTMNHEWLATLAMIKAMGHERAPRSMLTLELPSHTIRVDMRRPVLTVPERKLSYQFMAAEAYWILSGSNKVADIAPWNQKMRDFSDDGETLFGAYGPRIASQLDYVVAKLRADPDTRQAGLTIWRESPPKTRDVPCTVAIFASLRPINDKRGTTLLDLHVFMRSSDAWLGLPYDVFSFSMLAHLIGCRLNATVGGVMPGMLYLTAASSHLYQGDWSAATDLVQTYHTFSKPMNDDSLISEPTPPDFILDELALMTGLATLRDSKPGHHMRWWEATGAP